MAANVKVVSRIQNLKSRENYSEINSILATFAEISQTKEANSVIERAFSNIIKTQPYIDANWSNNFYTALFNTLNGTQVNSNLAYVPTGKTARLAEYNRMAQSAEINACLDEISDSAINFNEKKQIVEIQFNDVDYIPDGPEGQKKREELEEKRSILYKEFYKFIQPLKLQTKLHRYMKNFLKTGECCWENIIDPDNKEEGIIDFKFIPSHSFDFAYDKETYEKVGIWVKVLKTKTGSTLNYDDGSLASSASVRGLGPSVSYNSYTGNCYELGSLNRVDDYTQGDLLFLPWEQVTYVESGEHSPDDLIVYPLIEQARRPYNQLVCTEDSIIIYRLARSPTRLVFNVGVGMSNNSKAAQQVQQLIRKYNVAKTYNSTTGTTNNTRDPHTMTESFWFMKSANGEGTDVTELSSSVDMGELPDLEHFQKKLWAALHVPAKRFLEPDSAYVRSNDGIGQDEYRFCKFIIRLLSNFSEGIKNSFIVNLQLQGQLERLNIDESFFDIHFVNPLSYELFEQGRVLAQRIEMYKAITENEGFSKELAMKKYLNFTDDDVEDNWVALERETVRQKLIDAKADAIVEDEIEAFKEQLKAERLAKQHEEDSESHYDSTEDVVDDALDTEKSDEVKQTGVEQMAAMADQQQAQSGQSTQQQGSSQPQQQTSTQQEPAQTQQTPPPQQAETQSPQQKQ